MALDPKVLRSIADHAKSTREAELAQWHAARQQQALLDVPPLIVEFSAALERHVEAVANSSGHWIMVLRGWGRATEALVPCHPDCPFKWSDCPPSSEIILTGNQAQSVLCRLARANGGLACAHPDRSPDLPTKIQFGDSYIRLNQLSEQITQHFRGLNFGVTGALTYGRIDEWGSGWVGDVTVKW